MQRVLNLFAVTTLAVTTLCAGCTSQLEHQQAAVPGDSTESATVGEITVADSGEGDLQLVALEVPEMHCPFACWPKVQDTLAAQPNVREVKLAPQKDANAIDNPVVFVSYRGDFSPESAFEALSDAGFEGSKVTER